LALPSFVYIVCIVHIVIYYPLGIYIYDMSFIFVIYPRVLISYKTVIYSYTHIVLQEEKEKWNMIDKCVKDEIGIRVAYRPTQKLVYRTVSASCSYLEIIKERGYFPEEVN
jgi:hypothetical protein